MQELGRPTGLLSQTGHAVNEARTGNRETDNTEAYVCEATEKRRLHQRELG